MQVARKITGRWVRRVRHMEVLAQTAAVFRRTQQVIYSRSRRVAWPDPTNEIDKRALRRAREGADVHLASLHVWHSRPAAPITAGVIRWPGTASTAHAAGVRICLHDDVAQFAGLAGPLLDADPVRHTIAQTTLDRVRAGALVPALMLTLHRRGELAGAVLRTRDRPVIVSALPAPCATAVDAAAAEVDPAPVGVTGPVDEARAYAAAVTARTGVGANVAMRMRLFRLVALSAPTGVAGTARRAGPDDVELIAGWHTAFTDEAVRALPGSGDVRAQVCEHLTAGSGYLLWEVGGRPVAYAAARRPVAGMSRIGPVYTPSEHRDHGYGSAVTAAATAWALGAGARDVVLFTDLSNSVTNAIYPRIGYRPVHDALELTFG